MSTAEHLGSLAVAELGGLDLGRKGRDVRAVDLLTALSRDPTQSIRGAARSKAEEEAFYRFLSKDAVTMAALLKPHLSHTAERCQAVKKVVVPHDTSNFEYRGGKRAGLGRIRTKTSQGFLFHASLAVDAATGQPLGMLASKVWVRSDELSSVVEGKNGPRKKTGREYARVAHKESDRWVEQMKEAAEQLTDFSGKLIHVADREADIYSALAALTKLSYSFVIRLSRDKKAREAQDAPLDDLTTLARKAEGRLEVQAPIAARSSTTIPGVKKTFAEREARTARLEFAAISAQIEAPERVGGSLPINVVHVREIDPPDLDNPIEWFLLTSEPVDTIEQVSEVVQAYRTRWIIEEFFKALKTGCAMEDRELESLHTLTNVLALCIPIAYQLLAVRHLARTKPAAPAADVFTPTQIEILQAKTKLGPNPTALQALEAVAYLGSHFDPFSKKMPGWRVLSRGMQRLLALEEGWVAREAAEKVIER
jgi:Transposase DNA-binding/Transposase DDE domain